jgi:hypothetical protein
MKTYPIGAAGVPIQLVKPSRSTLRISTYGKGLRVANLYVKGKSFLGAAVLLERNKGNQSVVLHLVCQGLECILKAILLSLDYEMYRPLLKSKFGHKLLLIAETVTSETNTHLRSTTRAELTTLDNLYRQHLLRFSTISGSLKFSSCRESANASETVEPLYNKSLAARYKPLIFRVPAPRVLDTPSLHPEHSQACPVGRGYGRVGGRKSGARLRAADKKKKPKSGVGVLLRGGYRASLGRGLASFLGEVWAIALALYRLVVVR